MSHRYTVDMGDALYESMLRLSADLDVPTMSEIFRRSMALYEVVHEAVKSGKKLVIIEKNGHQTEIKIL